MKATITGAALGAALMLMAADGANGGGSPSGGSIDNVTGAPAPAPPTPRTDVDVLATAHEVVAHVMAFEVGDGPDGIPRTERLVVNAVGLRPEAKERLREVTPVGHTFPSGVIPPINMLHGFTGAAPMPMANNPMGASIYAMLSDEDLAAVRWQGVPESQLTELQREARNREVSRAYVGYSDDMAGANRGRFEEIDLDDDDAEPGLKRRDVRGYRGPTTESPATTTTPVDNGKPSDTANEGTPAPAGESAPPPLTPGDLSPANGPMVPFGDETTLGAPAGTENTTGDNGEELDPDKVNEPANGSTRRRNR